MQLLWGRRAVTIDNPESTATGGTAEGGEPTHGTSGNSGSSGTAAVPVEAVRTPDSNCANRS